MDKKIAHYLALENNRQNECLELIASENFTSKAVRELCGSILTNKYWKDILVNAIMEGVTY